MNKFRYIDSHVNLHAPQYDHDRAEVIERAFSSGVDVMLNICDRISNFSAVISIAETHDNIWATLGTHPHESKENPDLKVDDFIPFALHNKVVGIGECGLDFYYDLSPRDTQVDVFKIHIDAARETKLPLVVHTRDADDVMWEILKSETQKGPFKFLLHCYTSGAELAKRAADIGAYFSISGISTFKAAEDVRQIIKSMPEDRILIETDCPYLAPVPMRARRNEPSFIPHIYETVANIRGWTLDETREKTHRAFFELFDKIQINES